jgi:hypothetical protein
VPDRIERVMAAGPPASVLLYMLAPEKVIGWVIKPRGAMLPYLLPSVRDLPEIGRLTGRGGTASLEAVMAAKPDVIVDFGSVNRPMSASRPRAESNRHPLRLDRREIRQNRERAAAARRDPWGRRARAEARGADRGEITYGRG